MINMQKILLLFLALSSLPVVSSHSKDLDCTPLDPRTQVSSNVETAVKGSAKTLLKIGEAKGSFENKLSKEMKALNDKFPASDQTVIKLRLMYLFCTMMNASTEISMSKKMEMFESLQNKLVNAQSSKVQGKAVAAEKRQSKTTSKTETLSKPFDRMVARFGVALGWQLGRYEFIYGSDVPEAKAASAANEQEIADLLERDKFPYPVKGVSAQDLMHRVDLHYSSTNLQKHAAIMFGIATMRASLVGTSSDSSNNEQMEKLAYSAIAGIDTSIIDKKAKERLFRTLLRTKPKNVGSAVDLLCSEKP